MNLFCVDTGRTKILAEHEKPLKASLWEAAFHSRQTKKPKKAVKNGATAVPKVEIK